MNNKDLEIQAIAIDDVLERNKIHGRVKGGTITPRLITFTLSHPLPKGVRLESSLAQALDVAEVMLAGNTIKVVRTDAQPVSLLSMLGKITRPQPQPFPPCTAVLGLCDDGAPLLVRLPAKDVRHVMVTGDDGVGKTSLLKTMCLGLAMTNKSSQLRLVLIGDDLGDLAGLPHAREMTPDDAMQRLGHGNSMPRIVVAIDDLEQGKCITRLLAEGHESGIHVLATSLTGRSSAGYGLVIKAKGEPGDFEVMESDEAIHFQAAYISPDEINQVVRKYAPHPPRRLQTAEALAPTQA